MMSIKKYLIILIISACAVATVEIGYAAPESANLAARLFAEIIDSVSREHKATYAELLEHGNIKEAIARLKSTAMAEEMNSRSIELKRLAEELEGQDPDRWRTELHRVPLGEHAKDHRFDNIVAVQPGSRRMAFIGFVKTAVKKFIDRYAWGFRNAEEVYANASPREQQFLDSLLRVPKARRVMLIISSYDEEIAKKYSVNMGSSYKIVSYRDCERFVGKACSNEVIGAIAHFCGNVSEIQTENSAKSIFVSEERDAFQRLNADQALVTLVSTEEIASVLNKSGTIAAEVTARQFVMELGT